MGKGVDSAKRSLLAITCRLLHFQATYIVGQQLECAKDAVTHLANQTYTQEFIEYLNVAARPSNLERKTGPRHMIMTWITYTVLRLRNHKPLLTCPSIQILGKKFLSGHIG